MILLKELVSVSAKNKVEVRIGGMDYILVGQETDEYIQRVALYIDKKMNEITRANNKLSTTMSAVLTAVNVADDFFKAREKIDVLTKELEQVKSELEQLKRDNELLAEENSFLVGKNTSLQLDLAKREAELSEVRNSYERVAKARD